jgi:hypothetical protein
MKLDQVRRFALTLPDVTEEPHFHYTSFRVRGKIFATAPPDGGCVHVFLADVERELALALYPAFVEKLFWGKKLAGIRLTLATATPNAVNALLRQAWSHKAPKRLSAKAAMKH